MSARYWPRRVCFQTFAVWLVASVALAAASETDAAKGMSTGEVMGALVAALVAMTGAMVAIVNRWLAKVGAGVPRVHAHAESISHELRETIKEQFQGVLSGQEILHKDISQMRERMETIATRTHDLSGHVHTLIGKFDMLPCVRGNGSHRECGG